MVQKRSKNSRSDLGNNSTPSSRIGRFLEITLPRKKNWEKFENNSTPKPRIEIFENNSTPKQRIEIFENNSTPRAKRAENLYEIFAILEEKTLEKMIPRADFFS